MDRFLQALDQSLEHGIWYAALFVALSLPDICSKMDNPQEPSTRIRYAGWFEKYVGPAYKRRVGPQREEVEFLSGDDCYALRCACLHEGTDDTSTQSARDNLDKFQFVVPPTGSIIHRNMIDTKLQLQVDIFCRDIARGVQAWLRDVEGNTEIQQNLKTLLEIKILDAGEGIRF